MAVGDEQRPPPVEGNVLYTAGYVDEERVPGIENKHGQGVGGPRTQVPGRLISDVAQFLYRGGNPLSSVLAHTLWMVQRVGDGPGGHTSKGRNRPDAPPLGGAAGRPARVGVDGKVTIW